MLVAFSKAFIEVFLLLFKALALVKFIADEHARDQVVPFAVNLLHIMEALHFISLILVLNVIDLLCALLSL